MFNHAPKEYDCPFCRVVKGHDLEAPYTKQSDVVYRDSWVTAFICARWWENNSGHVLIIPNQHVENLYDLPSALSIKIHDLERKVAIAFKYAYACDGTSSRQHNEPSGSQEVWHYHLHVFPRYREDDLYRSSHRMVPAEERLPYAEKLKAYFDDNLASFDLVPKEDVRAGTDRTN